MSIIIDTDGEYKFKEGTKTLDTSTHPAHFARVELGIPNGEWLYAPNSGHTLNKFKNVKQSEIRLNEFVKEVELSLKKYGPEIQGLFGDRGGINMDLTIDESVLDV